MLISCMNTAADDVAELLSLLLLLLLLYSLTRSHDYHFLSVIRSQRKRIRFTLAAWHLNTLYS